MNHYDELKQSICIANEKFSNMIISDKEYRRFWKSSMNQIILCNSFAWITDDEAKSLVKMQLTESIIVSSLKEVITNINKSYYMGVISKDNYDDSWRSTISKKISLFLNNGWISESDKQILYKLKAV